jgi:hypothetical protein
VGGGGGGEGGLHSLSFSKQHWVNTKEEGTLLMNQWLGLRRENLHGLLVLGVELLAKDETKKIHKSMRIIMPHNGKSKNNNAYPALPWGMENLQAASQWNGLLPAVCEKSWGAPP